MKILAVANAGGHFIQLLRLRPALEGHHIAYLSSLRNFSELVPDSTFYFVSDANRNSKIKLITNFFKVIKIVIRFRPDVVITTGAALGLMGLVAGRLCRAKTIWVDSIANAEQVSMSGKIASRFANRSYTQWVELADDKFIYQGNIFV